MHHAAAARPPLVRGAHFVRGDVAHGRAVGKPSVGAGRLGLSNMRCRVFQRGGPQQPHQPVLCHSSGVFNAHPTSTTHRTARRHRPGGAGASSAVFDARQHLLKPLDLSSWRKPQQCLVALRGFATTPGRQRRGFMCCIASNTALGRPGTVQQRHDDQRGVKAGTVLRAAWLLGLHGGWPLPQVAGLGHQAGQPTFTSTEIGEVGGHGQQHAGGAQAARGAVGGGIETGLQRGARLHRAFGRQQGKGVVDAVGKNRQRARHFSGLRAPAPADQAACGR